MGYLQVERCQLFCKVIGIIALTDLENISLETIRSRLKDNELKPWKRKMWWHQKQKNNLILAKEAFGLIPNVEGVMGRRPLC